VAAHYPRAPRMRRSPGDRLVMTTIRRRAVASVSIPPPARRRRRLMRVSGDVQRAAVAAERPTVLSRATGERWSTAALTTGGANPAHHTPGACRMYAAQRLTGATPLTAVRGGAYFWKWDDHAHQNFTLRVALRMPDAVRRVANHGLSDGMIGRSGGRQAGTFVLQGPCYSPGLGRCVFRRSRDAATRQR